MATRRRRGICRARRRRRTCLDAVTPTGAASARTFYRAAYRLREATLHLGGGRPSGAVLAPAVDKRCPLRTPTRRATAYSPALRGSVAARGGGEAATAGRQPVARGDGPLRVLRVARPRPKVSRNGEPLRRHAARVVRRACRRWAPSSHTPLLPREAMLKTSRGGGPLQVHAGARDSDTAARRRRRPPEGAAPGARTSGSPAALDVRARLRACGAVCATTECHARSYEVEPCGTWLHKTRTSRSSRPLATPAPHAAAARISRELSRSAARAAKGDALVAAVAAHVAARASAARRAAAATPERHVAALCRRRRRRRDRRRAAHRVQAPAARVARAASTNCGRKFLTRRLGGDADGAASRWRRRRCANITDRGHDSRRSATCVYVIGGRWRRPRRRSRDALWPPKARPRGAAVPGY